MAFYPATTFLAACYAFLCVALSLNVSLRRRSVKTLFGDKDDGILRCRIRAFGNFAEYAPLGLILLFLFESGGGAPWLAFGFAVVLLAGRVSHAFGMLNSGGTIHAGIMAGMVLQHTTFAVIGLILVARLAGWR